MFVTLEAVLSVHAVQSSTVLPGGTPSLYFLSSSPFLFKEFCFSVDSTYITFYTLCFCINRSCFLMYTEAKGKFRVFSISRDRHAGWYCHALLVIFATKRSLANSSNSLYRLRSLGFQCVNVWSRLLAVPPTPFIGACLCARLLNSL